MQELILGTTKHGKGVFANRNFRSKEKILDFHGKLFTYEQLPYPYEAVEDHYVQIGENLYMGPSGSLDDFINHSCSPNSGLVVDGRKVYLIAIKDIQKGEEVTWDYSTTMDEDDWELDCECESSQCRRKVRDFKHLPPEIQNLYISLGVVPTYILERLKIHGLRK